MTSNARAIFGAGLATSCAFVVVCVILLTNTNQESIETAQQVQVFPMNKWHLSGPQARKQMQNFFNRENFNSEATHLENYVDNHPFFGRATNNRFMLSGTKRPSFSVFGFGKPHPRHAQKLLARKLHKMPSAKLLAHKLHKMPSARVHRMHTLHKGK
eukprot:CAMPEP_0181306670 /NCGR_PEP_ID=MMETSP1101-20121128/10434_1 /TAXON_ID=46948 /ORGANISM="Rhodomonas abbreviata, Strain Caron Lab Isolate" /LENGTH=156 /DNA_ID=CAMNT_0023412763 /DNA_START=110 /DNA_END=580 /DNA_ORIENTATION=+